MKNHKRKWLAVLILSAQLCAVTACSSKSDSEVKNGVPVQETNETGEALPDEVLVDETGRKYLPAYSEEDAAALGMSAQENRIYLDDDIDDEAAKELSETLAEEEAAAKAKAKEAGADNWYQYLPDDAEYRKYRAAPDAHSEYGDTELTAAEMFKQERDAENQNAEDLAALAESMHAGGSAGVSISGVTGDTSTGPEYVHEVDTSYDFRTEMAPGLHQDAMYDDQSTWSITIDECFITMQQCTVNSFMANTAHEWHFYNSKGEGPATLEPGEKGMCHLDSSYFSSPENKKTGTNKKNGQLVFYVKNTSGSAKSILDCTVYKVYISYISHGYSDYSEIPIVDYMGYQILDSAAKIADCTYFGEPRERKMLTDCDGYRYEFGSISNTRIMMDTLNTSSGELLLGITVESPI